MSNGVFVPLIIGIFVGWSVPMGVVLLVAVTSNRARNRGGTTTPVEIAERYYRKKKP